MKTLAKRFHSLLMKTSLSEQCPTSAPYQAINGHFCCSDEVDESTAGYECTHELVPCPSPPCITHKEKRRVECPMEHPFHFDHGVLCCRHYLGKNDSVCNGDRLGGESPSNCCRGDEHVACPGMQCKDHGMADSESACKKKALGGHSICWQSFAPVTSTRQ